MLKGIFLPVNPPWEKVSKSQSMLAVRTALVHLRAREQALRVPVLWRRGFGGKSEERGWDFWPVYFQNAALLESFSKISYPTFKYVFKVSFLNVLKVKSIFNF